MNDPQHPTNTNTQLEPLLSEQRERMETLETQVAYQEDWLEKLNTRLYQHERDIEALKQANQWLVQQLREQRNAPDATDPGFTPLDERPPHY